MLGHRCAESTVPYLGTRRVGQSNFLDGGSHWEGTAQGSKGRLAQKRLAPGAMSVRLASHSLAPLVLTTFRSGAARCVAVSAASQRPSRAPAALPPGGLNWGTCSGTPRMEEINHRQYRGRARHGYTRNGCNGESVFLLILRAFWRRDSAECTLTRKRIPIRPGGVATHEGGPSSRMAHGQHVLQLQDARHRGSATISDRSAARALRYPRRPTKETAIVGRSKCPRAIPHSTIRHGCSRETSRHRRHHSGNRWLLRLCGRLALAQSSHPSAGD